MASGESSVMNRDNFTSTFFPWFTGPQVTIRVGENPNNEFHVSKELICSQSPYFAKLLPADHLKENLEIVVTVAEIEGVFSLKKPQSPRKRFLKILEFTRLANMFGILHDVEKAMATRIKEVGIANLAVDSVKTDHPHLEILKAVELNHGVLATHIRIEHTQAASELPRGCEVRKVLAAAFVEGYLRKFPPAPWKGLEDTSSFAVDLMQQVKLALMTLQKASLDETDVVGYFRDPIIGELLAIPVFRRMSQAQSTSVPVEVCTNIK